MKGAMGPKEYGVLLTDQRAFFVLEKASRAVVIGVLGDALLTDRKEVNYLNENLDVLAANDKNVVVPYVGIQNIQLKKGISSYTLSNAYTLLVDFIDATNTPRSIKAFLQPPQELVKKKKAEGTDRKAVTEEYARNAKKALEQAMPPGVLQRGKWDI